MEILEDEILKLSGITDGVTYTLRYDKIPTFDRMTIFHVVDNDFIILQSGILSSEFFSDNSTKIDYETQVFEVSGTQYTFRTGEVMTFAAGERKLFFARVINNIEEEYTPYMTYEPGGIVIEPGFVRNQDGKVYFFLTNAYDYLINIEIPVIKLMSVKRFHEILSLETKSKDEIYKRKESENIVLKTDKNKKIATIMIKKKKILIITIMIKKEKNPGSLEKVVPNNVEKEKSPGNREIFVPNFDEIKRNPRSHENIVPSFDKNEKNPGSLEKVVSNNVQTRGN